MIDNKDIIVGGRALTVHRAGAQSLGSQLRRYTLIETALKDEPFPGEGLEALVRNNYHQNIYPSLAACTTGEIPTETEALDFLPNDDLDLWVRTAQELNPAWFPAPDETEETRQEKKQAQE